MYMYMYMYISTMKELRKWFEEEMLVYSDLQQLSLHCYQVSNGDN